MDILAKLNSIGQTQLLRYWDTLDLDQRKRLQTQVEALDTEMFLQQKVLWENKQPQNPIEVAPVTHCAHAGNLQIKTKGREVIAAGQYGCILIAGGQGTRLQFDGPKGMYPVTPIGKKTLFQLFAEKTAAASKQAGRLLPLAIMTSPATHQTILDFFKSHHNFGLHPDQLFFFTQSTLPLLDEAGNLFLESQGCLAEGPDGNGSTLKCFVDAGIWEHWRSQGIRYAATVLIDNPLADPFDAELAGFHATVGGEAIVKCTTRLNSQEKVGVIVKIDGQIQVVEYSELPDSERQAQLPDGSLKHPFANLSLFSLDMDFIKAAAQQDDRMPLHLAHKAANAMGAQVMAWKFEKYIFDVLSFASQTHLLNYPREYCFAPLKNKEGPDSLATVQAALQTLDRLTYAQVTGKAPPPGPIELPQEFYYPTPKFLL